jgi:radical SAM-linked protein
MTRMRTRRVDYLEDMAAFEPQQQVSLPVYGSPTANTAPKSEATNGATPEEANAAEHSQKPRARLAPERYRPPQLGVNVVRYRLRYAKKGAAALLGHLDVIRELGRVIRRAGVRVFYTEGFHPKPSMSFGPALSLGVMSLDEYVDVKLVDPPATVRLLESLNRASAGGFEFLGARPIGPGAPAVGRVIVGARYLVLLSENTVADHGGRAWLEACVQKFLAEESIRVIRRTRGLGKPIDVRRAVKGLQVLRDRPELLDSVVASASHYVLEIEQVMGHQGSAKLSEVIEALLQAPGFPYLAVRTRLLPPDSTRTPLDFCEASPQVGADKKQEPSLSL